MASLGRFGRTPEPAPQPDTFEFFGEEFSTNPDFVDLDLVDFMEMGARMDSGDVAAMGQMKQAFRTVILPADFDRFWQTARTNRQGIEDLMPLYQAIVQAATDRPTGASSDSSDGGSRTQLRSVSAPVDQAMDLLSGRPDLQSSLMTTVEGNRVSA